MALPAIRTTMNGNEKIEINCKRSNPLVSNWLNIIPPKIKDPTINDAILPLFESIEKKIHKLKRILVKTTPVKMESLLN
jgi:hypothetical protein